MFSSQQRVLMLQPGKNEEALVVMMKGVQVKNLNTWIEAF